MVSIRAYYKSSWLVIRTLAKSSNLFNRMGIISGWSAVLITDAKSTVKNAEPLYTYYTTNTESISNERFCPYIYHTKSQDIIVIWYERKYCYEIGAIENKKTR